MLNRIGWIDIARGIGIILVIYGHALSADSFRHLIYAFHMPLFFFLSGLVFDYKKNSFFITFKKSFRGIIVPYIIFAMISYILWISENFGSYLTVDLVLKHLSGIIYANSSSLFFNIILWFLPCLFITKLFFAFITETARNLGLVIFLLISLSVAGYLTSISFPDLKLPFGIESALTAVVFFGIGSIFRSNYFETLTSFFSKKKVLLVISLILFSVVLATINFNIYGYQIDLRLNRLSNYFLFYLSAFSGIFGIIIFSQLINKNRVLELVGSYSLALFAFHPIVFFYFNRIGAAVTSKSVIDAIKDIYLSPLYTVLSIGVILCFVVIIKRVKVALVNRVTYFYKHS